MKVITQPSTAQIKKHVGKGTLLVFKDEVFGVPDAAQYNQSDKSWYVTGIEQAYSTTAILKEGEPLALFYQE